jgi:hypothetical protein
VLVTVVMAYMIFALAEVGLEIENPWGDGPNDLDLDRYCMLLALDLEEIMATTPPKRGWSEVRFDWGSREGSGVVTPIGGVSAVREGLLVDLRGEDVGEVV